MALHDSVEPPSKLLVVQKAKGNPAYALNHCFFQVVICPISPVWAVMMF